MTAAATRALESPPRLMRLEEALERMLDGVVPLPAMPARLADPASVLGRVLASDVLALVTMPPWDDSAMDGFAVRAGDVAGATEAHPVELRVTGEAAAGRPAQGRVEVGTAVRILTGAPMPAGADAVVPVEQTDAPRGIAELPAVVTVTSPVAEGAHIRRAGSDLVAGRTVLDRGTVLRPRHVGVLVAAGYADVPLHARPRLTVISTGDELTEPGAPLDRGRIHDSNGPALTAQALAAGAEIVRTERLADDLAAVEASLRAAVGASDVLVVSGGVSLGAHDVVKEAFERVGRIDLWRVAVQPGKPLAFGRATRPDGGVALLFGLPGNPVSSFVTFELFVLPVLQRLCGRRDPVAHRTVTARLAEAVTKSEGRRAFMRVTLEPLDDESAGAGVAPGWLARLAGGQGSHMLSALAAADGLAVVPEEVDGLPAGASVTVRLLDEGVD